VTGSPVLARRMVPQSRQSGCSWPPGPQGGDHVQNSADRRPHPKGEIGNQRIDRRATSTPGAQHSHGSHHFQYTTDAGSDGHLIETQGFAGFVKHGADARIGGGLTQGTVAGGRVDDHRHLKRPGQPKSFRCLDVSEPFFRIRGKSGSDHAAPVRTGRAVQRHSH
jgi:hypothetical protein